MWPDQVLNSELLVLKSEALPTALLGPAAFVSLKRLGRNSFGVFRGKSM